MTDHGSAAFFQKLLGKSISFASTPAAFIVHTFLFIFFGVVLYAGVDSIFNPSHAGKRWVNFKEEVYNTYVGSNSAWFEPFVAPLVGKVLGKSVKDDWFWSSLLPATLAYSSVKGTGWKDRGNNGLNALEKQMNGLPL